ncbi:MAG: hypothetical protein WCX73_05080 [Candidatus Pacearchaeota archaeon]|jgi:hypothetical protein
MSLFKFSKQPSIDEREKQLQKDRDELYHSNNLLKLESDYQKVKTDLAVQSANDKGNYEHEYHQAMAEKEAHLVILDKEIELKKEYINTEVELQTLRKEKELLVQSFTAIIAEKDASIERLDGAVKVLITKLPNVDLKNMNINVESNK